LQRSLHSTRSQNITRGPANIRVPAPRLAPHGTTSVDRRTTTVQIVGFKVDDSDALLGHFKHFGEITKNQLDKDVPFLQITYATRVNAEQAILRGKKFKDSVLQVSESNKTL
jgi:RNA-binding protein 26